MSFTESKPQINSIDNNVNPNDIKPIFGQNESIKGLDTTRRLLTPSRLSDIICNQNPNQSMVYLNMKRLSESEDTIDRQRDIELSPLFKRIKKENNNCLLFDSKQFIKQELDKELDFNSRQPMVNLFSKLSLEKSGLSAGESSNCGSELPEANDLSDVLKQLNICHKSNQNSNNFDNQMTVKKKKKNKKSKKSREKKFKVTKNVFKTNFCNNSHKSSKKFKSKTFTNIRKEPKGQYLFKIQSKVIKELKVSASGGLTAEEVQLLIAFKDEGVVRKHSKIGSVFKCLLCKLRFTERPSVEEHIKCDNHLKNKCEQNYSKIDSMFALDLGKNSDIEVLLSRRRVLSQLSAPTKQHLHSKGIRLKNGFGSDAFICIECNEQPFELLDDVFRHLEYKLKLINGLNNITLESNPGFSASFGPQVANSFNPINDKQINERQLNNDMKTFESLTSEQLIKLFESEGIVRKMRNRSKKKRLKYFCMFCEKYRTTEYETFKHINDRLHLRAKARVNT